MKKLISLLLILCMACMLVPAVAEDSAAGTWYMAEMTQGEMTFAPSQLGMTWSLTLAEDGTASSVMEMMGEKEESTGTWTQDGDSVTITIDDQPAVFAFADGKLTLDQGERGKAVFTQDAPEAAAAPSAGVAAESEDVFLGNWELTAIGMMGMTFTKDMFAAANMSGFDISLTVEAGKATMTAVTSADAAPSTFETTTALVDGNLVLSVSDVTIATITMLEDGTISFLFNLGGFELTVYMAPAGAAAAPAA